MVLGIVTTMFTGPGNGAFSCMACGTDLWDVARHLRAGGVIVCDRCVGVMSDALADGPESGQIDVLIPPRVQGPVPDADAQGSVVEAFMRTFGGEAERRADFMENADELGPMLDHARNTFAANLDPRVVVDRVRFPDPDSAEVRFRILLRGSPEGMRYEGRAIRSQGRWRVTRATVISVLPGGGVGFHRAVGQAGIVGAQLVADVAPPESPDVDDDDPKASG